LNGKKGDSLSKSTDVRPETLVAAMVMTFVFGLGAITLLLGVMKAILGFDTGQLLAFTVLSFLIMLSLEGVFVRLLLRRKHGTEEADAVLLRGTSTKELDVAQAPRLAEPAFSVTEHTTRAFEPVHNERSAK
jgi:hypothetical protein